MKADLHPLQVLLVTLAGWVNRHQQHVIEYLVEENRVLKEQVKGRRLRLTDDQRRRLAAKGRRLSQRVLRQVATIGTPDTILRWHRQLIARKWTFTPKRPGRPGIMPEISSLIVRMATENPGWGYTRIQGALKNLGHSVARSTVAKVLKANGIPPAADRPTSWRTFLRGPLGRDRGGGLLHERGLDPSRSDHLLHALRDRSPKPTGSHSGVDAHPGCGVHGAGGASTDRCGRWVPGAPPGPHLRSRQQVDRRIPPDRPRRRGTDRVDARPGAECQRLRGTLRALDPRGVSRPPDLVRETSPAPRP
jgi:hypothetical protein